MCVTFNSVFAGEIKVINHRRREIRAGKLAKARGQLRLELKHAAAGTEGDAYFLRARSDPVVVTGSSDPRARSGRLVGKSDLTGLAFSGGGIRSAAFCLGVVQGLDSLSNSDEPQVLDAIDYLSVVSGGSYIGTSLVAGMMQPDYTFPFDSKIGDQETREMQHLRDYSNFLVPNGFFDYLISAALICRGLLINAVVILPVLLFAAACTLWFNPTIADLTRPDFLGGPLPWQIPGQKSFAFTTDLVILLAFLFLLAGIWNSFSYRRGQLGQREKLGRYLAWFVIFVLVSAFFEFQSFVLAQMFSPPSAGATSAAKTNEFTAWLAATLPSLSAFLVPVATVLIGFAQRLANIAKATIGEQTWQGALKKHAARAALYVAALIVPFLLWVAYLYLTFWGYRQNALAAFNQSAPALLPWLADHLLPQTAPAWLVHCVPTEWFQRPRATFLYLELAIILAVISWLIGPNANSLHQLYRDRLSRAFVIDRANPSSKAARFDRQRFSSLKPACPNTSDWTLEAACSPYLLVNTAINLENSKELNKRGRNADNFIFSPLYVGSGATGYVTTKDMENTEGNLGLATAMATSGAAASANMGAKTIKILTFSLSVLNVRLGYWLANPRHLGNWLIDPRKLSSFRHVLRRIWSNFGPYYFATETLGLLDEKNLNVYLTDGGHVENLGIYELLRRRCKVIIAADAEADQEMSFPSFVRLQVLARIDLGVLIDLPWPSLQADATQVTDKVLHGPKGWPGSKGPHAAIGRIDYGDGESGVLIYLKASMSGDESDYVIDYKRRNPTFPHETTVDQFFSEEQFEVYRALGFHACRNLFAGADAFATRAGVGAEWKKQVRDALALLNVPPAMADKVVEGCDPPPKQSPPEKKAAEVGKRVEASL
jgi:hypothetical protein